MKTHESRCGKDTVRGTPKQIVAVYEGKAYNAQRAGDEYNANVWFQHAEHWKRVKE